MVEPSQESPKAPLVPCPQCGKQNLFAPSNPWRPFCSERCKLIDVGAWANEDFRIQAAPPALDGGIEEI